MATRIVSDRHEFLTLLRITHANAKSAPSGGCVETRPIEPSTRVLTGSGLPDIRQILTCWDQIESE